MTTRRSQFLLLTLNVLLMLNVIIGFSIGYRMILDDRQVAASQVERIVAEHTQNRFTASDAAVNFAKVNMAVKLIDERVAELETRNVKAATQPSPPIPIPVPIVIKADQSP